MKKIIFVVLLLSLCLSLFSCGKIDEESTGTVLFQDNFENATATPWVLTVPVNGWSNPVGLNKWNIVAGGVSGNALQYLGNGSGAAQLANGYSNSNYKISVQFMPVNLFANSPFCLAGRINGSDNGYVVCVNDDTSNVYLNIENYNGSPVPVSLASILVPSAHPLNNAIWYTLTMTLNGTAITGTISGGTLTDTTVTFTDSTYTTGKVGLMVWSGNLAYDIRFDNFVVTAL